MEHLRSQLEDYGDDYNIRRIFERLPEPEIHDALRVTLANRTDFRRTPKEISSTVAYFIGVGKTKATALGINLGFKPSQKP